MFVQQSQREQNPNADSTSDQSLRIGLFKRFRRQTTTAIARSVVLLFPNQKQSIYLLKQSIVLSIVGFNKEPTRLVIFEAILEDKGLKIYAEETNEAIVHYK